MTDAPKKKKVVDPQLAHVISKQQKDATDDNNRMARKIRDNIDNLRVVLIVQRDMLGQRFADINNVAMMKELDFIKTVVEKIGGTIVMFTETTSVSSTHGITLDNMFPDDERLDRFRGWSLEKYVASEENSAAHSPLPETGVSRPHIQKVGDSSTPLTYDRFQPIGSTERAKIVPLLLTYDPQLGSRMLRMGYRYLLYPNSEVKVTPGIVPTLNPHLGSFYSVGILLKTMSGYLFPFNPDE